MNGFKLDKWFNVKNNRTKNTVIYTAITGNYDMLKPPPAEILEKADFICFTDDFSLKAEDFQVVYLKNVSKKNHQMISRKIKILAHKYLPRKYEYSIWVDGSIQLNVFDVEKFLEKYLIKDKWAAIQHPERNCIYDEALECLKLKKDTPDSIYKQIKKCRRDNYPKDHGLVANGFIARKHLDREVIKINKLWWKEFKNGSKRDQLSFCYIAWKNDFKYKIIYEPLWDNKYFKVLRHGAIQF